MIIEFDIQYKPSYSNTEVQLKFLTVKQIINDPLLKRILVLFFEAPSPLIILEKEQYKFSVPENQILRKIRDLIKDDCDKLLQNIFEFDNQKTINENFLIVSAVEKLKKAYAVAKFEKERKLLDSFQKISKPILEIAPETLQNERLKVCKSCEFFDAVAIKGNGACNDCNCPILHKVKFLDNTCPQAKWI